MLKSAVFHSEFHHIAVVVLCLMYCAVLVSLTDELKVELKLLCQCWSCLVFGAELLTLLSNDRLVVLPFHLFGPGAPLSCRSPPH